MGSSKKANAAATTEAEGGDAVRVDLHEEEADLVQRISSTDPLLKALLDKKDKEIGLLKRQAAQAEARATEDAEIYGRHLAAARERSDIDHAKMKLTVSWNSMFQIVMMVTAFGCLGTIYGCVSALLALRGTPGVLLSVFGTAIALLLLSIVTMALKAEK